MKNLSSWFQEQDTDSKKFVYAILITRDTYKNPLTPDGFCTVLVYRNTGEFQPWNFNSLEDMFTWLGQALTYGFAKEKPEWIMERLWDEVIEHEERSGERKYRYP